MYIHGHFYNSQGDKITVHLLTRGDRSEELEIGDGKSGLYFTTDPVEIESQVNDTFDHLLLQQASIRLLAKDYLDSLFTADCRDAVVNIYRGERCVFAGFVEPMALSQGYNEVLDEIELTCIDCLCALKYAKYRDIGSLGVLYSVVRAEADQRSFMDILKDITSGITSGLDIVGGGTVPVYYDGSKAVDAATANHYSVFAQLSVNELLFLGSDEDSVWGQDEVLEEVLRFLNLHIIQDGLAFYIFSWETIKGMEDILWQNLETGVYATSLREVVEISTDKVVGAETTVSVGEVYNRLQLTCKVESVESLVESPLDDDLLRSPYSNKQLYMTEYSSDGKTDAAIEAFAKIIQGDAVNYDAALVTDWYLQVKNNLRWTFPNMGSGDLVAELCGDNRLQQALPNCLASQQGAAILALGRVERTADGQDNAPVSKIDMTDYLVVSVNGNGQDAEDKASPNAEALKASMPCAVYVGSTSGGVFSPADDETTNYIVLSGKVVLNPLMKVTDNYLTLDSRTDESSATYSMEFFKVQYKDKRVESRDSEDGRYYTQQWWKADTPSATAVWDVNRQGLVPYTDKGPQQYEFKYSAIGDGEDHISKIAVLACMLVIGDKCVVETGTQGRASDFEWREYKPIEECADEDEYYGQCFTVGFNPKIGDKLIGTLFDFQNNIVHTMGIDAEGIAIPIRRSDRLSGRVQFKILGPVNMLWDNVTRRHPTWFRHTAWSSTSVPLLSHVSSIMLENFEVKVYSDNALVNNTGESDIVYVSDTHESFVNLKNDLEMRISSALTAAECRALDVTDSIKMSTPLNTETGNGVTEIYDYNRGAAGKAEQQYVDSYYNEYHAPRIVMTQRLADSAGGGYVDWMAHYSRAAMPGRDFFVQAISRNLGEGYADLTLKEIEP